MSGIKYYPRTPIPTPASATPLGDTSGWGWPGPAPLAMSHRTCIKHQEIKLWSIELLPAEPKLERVRCSSNPPLHPPLPPPHPASQASPTSQRANPRKYNEIHETTASWDRGKVSFGQDLGSEPSPQVRKLFPTGIHEISGSHGKTMKSQEIMGASGLPTYAFKHEISPPKWQWEH